MAPSALYYFGRNLVSLVAAFAVGLSLATWIGLATVARVPWADALTASEVLGQALNHITIGLGIAVPLVLAYLATIGAGRLAQRHATLFRAGVLGLGLIWLDLFALPNGVAFVHPELWLMYAPWPIFAVLVRPYLPPEAARPGNAG